MTRFQSLVRAALQRHRASAPPAVRKAATLVRGRAGVGAFEETPDAFEATVTDPEGTDRIRIDRTSGDVRCTCVTMKRLATCQHALAALEELFRGLHGASDVAPAPAQSARSTGAPEDYLARLERLGAKLNGDRRASAIERGEDDDPWVRADLATRELRYVLHVAARRDGAYLRLEAQARAAGATREGDWESVPFANAAGGREGSPLAAHGPRHAAVAAVAAGARDAARVAGAEFARSLSVASVERALAPTLLTAAESAAPLVARLGARTKPLELRLDRPARLEVGALSADAQHWTLGAEIVLADGARHGLAAVVAISADGIVVIDLAGAALLVLLDAPAARHVVHELSGAPIRVPRTDGAALASLAGVVTLVGEDLLNAAHPIEPVAHLRVEAPEERGGGHAMRCYVEFDYGGTRVTYGALDEVVPSLDGRVVPRRRAFEDVAIARFFGLGARRSRGMRTAEHDATVAASRFPGMVATLLDEGWRVLAEGRHLRAPGRVSLSVASGVDWFELQGGVDYDGEEVPFPRVLAAAQEGRAYVELGGGARGLLPETWLERWRLAALGEATEDGDALRFDRSAAWVLGALADELGATVDDPFRALRSSLHSLAAPAPERPPASFHGTLRPYQEEGLGWLRLLDRVGLSGLLADDMGLGKTVQVLAYIAARHERDAAARFLVVAPRSLVFNWLHEAKRFVPGLATVDFSGPGRWRRLRATEGGALCVTTYGALRRDAEALRDEPPFDVLVLDEAHAIKSRTSQTTLAARAIRATRRISLTGTPIENRLGELWSQLEFLNPGMLQGGAPFARLASQRDGLELADEGRALLARALRPIVLRRTKAGVLSDLPPKTEQVLVAPMPELQERAYTELTDHYRRELSLTRTERRELEDADPGRPTLNVLAALTRLRQCACHPGLVDRSMLAERSGKLDLVLPMLRDITAAGGKALCFSSFTGLLGLVRTRLETARVPYLVLDGSTRDRGALVNRFQSAPAGVVFLISIKAGGAGLNLTAADYVFLLDPWWNPAVEAQAVDRAHRIGRERPVHVYRVVTEGTVEARVMELQEKKRNLAADVLGGATSSLAGLDAKDLAFLVSG